MQVSVAGSEMVDINIFMQEKSEPEEYVEPPSHHVLSAIPKASFAFFIARQGTGHIDGTLDRWRRVLMAFTFVSRLHRPG